MNASAACQSPPRRFLGVRTFGLGLFFQRVLFAVLVAAALAPAPVARGQDDEISDAFDMGVNALTRRGTEKYAQILKLDDDQKEASKALFEGYTQGVKDVYKEMAAFMKELGEKAAETQDYTVYQKELATKMKVFQERAEKLQDGFFDDLKSLIRDDQAERWPRVERCRLREEIMQMGLVSGSAVDLSVIADKLKIDPDSDAALAEQFERWEVEVDKPLSVFKQSAKQMQAQMLETMSGDGAADPMAMMDKAQKAMEALMVPARQVRDINRQYERLIVPMLPPETAAGFDAEFKLRSFPRVYRKTHATKALAAAEGFADLSEEQRQTLANIRQAYLRDLGPANEKWASEIEAKENQGGGSIMEMWTGGMGGDDANDPVAQARKARRELDDQTRDRIVAALTEDQRSRLPEKGPTTDNPWEDYQALQEEEGEDPGH